MPLGYAPKIGDVLAYYGRERKDIAQAIFNYGKDRKVRVTNDPGVLGGGGGQHGIPSIDNVIALAKGFLDGNENSVPKKYPAFHGTIARFSKGFFGKSHVGADIVIDIDVKDNFREAFKQGKKVIDFLDSYNVPYRIKFSGGSGPHIIIPYEYLPKSLSNGNSAKAHQQIFSTISSRSKAGHIDGSFTSAGHFYRIPYSINEHTGLVSLPLQRDQYDDFTPSMADMWKVEVDESWFVEPDESEKEAILDMLGDTHGKKQVKIFDKPAKMVNYDTYVGKYDYGNFGIMNITKKGDHLYAQLFNQPKYEIFPKAKDEFFWKVINAQIKFMKNEKGDITHAIHHQDGAEFAVGKIKDENPANINSAVYLLYIGEYVIPQLGIITISGDRNKIFAQLQEQPKIELLPRSETEFFSNDVNINVNFVNDGKRKIIINQGEVKIEGIRREDQDNSENFV